MKPISASPNYNSKGAVKAVVSWTAVYKIEIPAYENPITRRTEYANLINGGIEITLSAGGKILSFKYNLLPVSSQKSAALYKVVADESAVPQLVYLLNKNTNTVAPFYLSATETAYIPASRESIPPDEEPGEAFKNPMGFDKDRIVVWLMNPDVKKRKLKIFDFFAPRKKDSDNNLPAGAKLIRLEPASETDENTPCVYWWEGSYHQKDFPERSLGKNNNIITELSGQVLQNDVEHLLSRISSYEKKQDEYDKVIKSIRDFSKKLLTKEQIDNGLIKLNSSLQLNKNDKPATILTWQKVLSDVYNPKVNETTNFFDEVLILPLSYDWFMEDKNSITPTLSTYYEETWQGDPLLNRFVGDSGEVVLDENDLIKVKSELLNLRSFVLKTAAKNSPEAAWLQNLTKESLNRIKLIVFVHSATWHYRTEKYAESAALENSFGVFKLSPVLNLLIHEFTGHSNFLFFATGTKPDGTPSDRHIDVKDTEATWNKVSKSGLGSLKQNEDFIDHLYQSHRALGSIALAVIISKISNL